MSIKPTIVIVPGSFASTKLYADLKSQLVDEGFETIVVSLPSVGTKKQVNGITLEDDAARIRETVLALVEQGKDVVQMMHSYGGVPGSESTRGLLKTDREAEGKDGGVVHLVYVSAMIAPAEKIIAELDTGTPKEGLMNVDEGWLYLNHDLAAKYVFNDLPFDQGKRLATLMPGHSALTFAGKLSYPAYHHAPVTYILCENDEIIPIDAQRNFIEIAKEGNANVAVISVDSGHCPTNSRPEFVVEVIKKVSER